MDKPLLLPKTDEEGVPYLSYSQINKWKDSKRDYIRKYFLGESEDNVGLKKYGDFGNLVGEAFENDDYSAFDDDEIKFLKKIPKFDEFEREIKFEMKGFYIKGFIDTNTAPQVDTEDSIPFQWVKKLADYKTGDVAKKGSSKVDYTSKEYIQVELYAAALRKLYGKAPAEGYVYLIGRSGNAFAGQELKLTKELLTIERDVSPKRLDEVEQQVQDIAEEISSYYTAYLELNKLI